MIIAGALFVYVIASLVFGGVYVYEHWGSGYGTGALFSRAVQQTVLWPVRLAEGRL